MVYDSKDHKLEIMEPGDPNADPSLVYNCRCTLGYVYPKYDHLVNHDRNYRTVVEDKDENGNVTGTHVEYKNAGNVTFREWQERELGSNGQQHESMLILRKQVELSTPVMYNETKKAMIVETAVNGGKYAGKLEDALMWKEASIAKSIRSCIKTADEHLEKIRNPSMYDAGWEAKTQEAKMGLLRKWRKDYIRNTETSILMEYAMNERRK